MPPPLSGRASTILLLAALSASGLLAAPDKKSPRADGAAKAFFRLDVLPKNGEVTFLATGWPNALKIEGRGPGPSGAVAARKDGVRGTLGFALDGLVTGIDRRDDHMWNTYLETVRYPDAVLTLTRVDAPPLGTGDFHHVDRPFDGTLALHGVKHAVGGTVTVRRQGAAVDADARFRIRLADFAIDTPSFAGVTVAQDVDVRVRFTATAAR